VKFYAIAAHTRLEETQRGDLKKNKFGAGLGEDYFIVATWAELVPGLPEQNVGLPKLPLTWQKVVGWRVNKLEPLEVSPSPPGAKGVFTSLLTPALLEN
jgi:hypothetical protein